MGYRQDVQGLVAMGSAPASQFERNLQKEIDIFFIFLGKLAPTWPLSGEWKASI